MTGGPGGDVAGNAMRLLLDHSPKVKINLILDGTGAFYDPDGADHEELRRILLAQDIEPLTRKTASGRVHALSWATSH